MESTLHLALMTRQSEYGMLTLVRLCLDLSLAMIIGLPLLHSHLMESTLYLALGTTTIRVWDADTGQIVSGPFTGHDHYVTSVAFSPDGKHIVSGSWDKTQSEYGMLTLVRLCLDLSLAIIIMSPLLHSHLMESTLHLALGTRQSEHGMLIFIRSSLDHSLVMNIMLPPLSSHFMETMCLPYHMSRKSTLFLLK
jgi:hypothetical protein